MSLTITYAGGFKVFTTLDTKMQKSAEAQIENELVDPDVQRKDALIPHE